MIEYKQNVAAKVPVRLQDSSGNGVAGVAYGSATVTLWKADGTTAAVVMSAANWTEITAGAFASTGTYQLSLAATDLNVAGEFMYAVAVSNAQTYIGVIKVVANEEADTYAVATNTNTTVGTINTTVNATNTKVGNIWAHTFGKWEIVTSGADANRLVFYDSNGVVLAKFDLTDSSGNQTTASVFKRTPISGTGVVP